MPYNKILNKVGVLSQILSFITLYRSYLKLVYLDFVGCYRDQWSRTLNGKKTTDRHMTYNKCKNICAHKEINSKYFGLEVILSWLGAVKMLKTFSTCNKILCFFLGMQQTKHLNNFMSLLQMLLMPKNKCIFFKKKYFSITDIYIDMFYKILS